MRSFRRSTTSNRELWDAKAEEWHAQVGERGDDNRLFNSDPVLWRFLGDIDGSTVLDAGCGTGYLARQLREKGANVIAVDFSPTMVEVARRSSEERGLSIDYRVDSCESLATVDSDSVDTIVSNYVLQDLPGLSNAVRAFHRVLRSGGSAALVFSHPCFPQSDATELASDGSVTYRWRTSYFEEHEVEEAPSSHFSTPFVSYHRPLSAYFRAFRDAEFELWDFDEPVVSSPPPLGYDPARLPRSLMRPNSAALLVHRR